MFRLGLRLVLNSGREALVRFFLTTIAVAIGVTVLLGVFAEFHAFQTTSKTPFWWSARPATDLRPGNNSNVALWNHSASLFEGRTIEQLEVAALGPNAPVPPGLSRLPGAGQYYVSPALAGLLRSTPADELGNRYAGAQVGTIGEKGLTGPGQLAIVAGYSPAKLAVLPGTVKVDTIATRPKRNGTTNLYREAFGIGAIAILFPLLILIGTATRLASARRDERYAAMRLAGFTPHQINLIASVDAMTSALLGTLVGIGIFLLVRPALADVSLAGTRFFANYVTPTIWGYLGMVLLVPIASAFTALFSLRRVQISPLGVSREARSSSPSVWRLLPLLVGVPLFVAPLLHGKQAGSDYVLVFAGLLFVMIGLVVGGPWLTLQISRLLAKSARSTASLLAARRLADNPRTAFRSVSGLMLAVFVGTAVAVLAPAEISAQSSGSYASLNNVLRVLYLYDNPLTQRQEAGLLHGLQTFPGVSAIPIYANPAIASSPSGDDNTPDSIIGCADLKQLPEFGSCSAGISAVTANANKLLTTDNPLTVIKNLPTVNSTNTPAAENLKSLSIDALLVKANTVDTIEKVRTFLSAYDVSIGAGSGETPETYGEVAQIRNNDDKSTELIILAAVILTLLVAGCSLAVTVGGSLIERKRAFTLLRLSGISASTLYRVVLLESLVPLAAASLLAGVLGYAIAIPVVKAIEPAGTHVSHPGSIYYITVGIGLTASVVVVVSVLPLLERITKPDNARFE